jgi:hypothetical protein
MVLLCGPRIKTAAFRASAIGNPPFERGMGTLSSFGCELRTSTKGVRHVLRRATGILLINLGLCERAQEGRNIPSAEKGVWSREAVCLCLKEVSSENGLGDASF